MSLSLIMMIALVGCQSSDKETQETSSDNSKTVTFYLIRHGETLFNKKGLAQGWCDSPLTKNGISQATALGKVLSGMKFNSAYTSISERAIDTANLVLKDKDMTPVLSENLKEMNFGDLEVEPSDILFRDSFKRLIEPEGWSDVGGESWSELAGRVKKELDNIVLESKDGEYILKSINDTSYLEKGESIK